MPDDGGPDVVIKQLTPVPDNPAMDEVTRFDLRFSDAFWHRFYAGLAMQSIIHGGLTNAAAANAIIEETMTTEVVSSYECVAKKAGKYADAMIAHKNTEDDGDRDGPV